jgi:hypothetical protein
MHRGIDPSRDSENYILDKDGNPQLEPDLEAWIAWMQLDERPLAETQISAEVCVRTRFMGTDQRRTKVGPPLLWATVIEGGEHHDYEERYASRDEALKGHEKAVALAKDQGN